MSNQDCIFCKIAEGDIPATVVHQDDDIVAFRDANPQAPTHILVIPRRHIPSLDAAGPDQAELLGSLLLRARALARDEGVADDGYRTVLNVGADGGQTVHHVHLHLLGGRAMDWPPG